MPAPSTTIDVGGGFPAAYRATSRAFEAFVGGDRARRRAGTGSTCELQCEPGRVLVADGASVLARVELRRDRAST